MKKVIALLAVISLTGILSSCEINNVNSSKEKENNSIVDKNNYKKNSTNHTNDENKKQETQLNIQDYYPIKENTRYIYEGTGNEFASYNVYNDYISGEKVQQRINNGGTVIASVIELKDGKLNKIYSRGEVYYRENLLEATGYDEETLLMEPLKNGTTWTLKDSRVRTITNTSADIMTPTGTFKAIEVTTVSTDGKNLDYYAKNMGLIKSIYISGDTQISSTLSKIEENVPEKQNINFYYPNINDGKLYFKNKEVSFRTNEITRKVLAEAYKEEVNNQLGKVFSPNTQINSLYLNNDQHVYIDLNQDFIKEMQAGAHYETMILQSVANTFGQYYHSDRVYLTINNNPYESGHISIKKGEYLKVGLQNIIEMK
jgi:hypothetical protein